MPFEFHLQISLPKARSDAQGVPERKWLQKSLLSMHIRATAAHHLVLNLVSASLLLTALVACRGILLVALSPHFNFAVSAARRTQNFSPTLGSLAISCSISIRIRKFEFRESRQHGPKCRRKPHRGRGPSLLVLFIGIRALLLDFTSSPPPCPRMIYPQRTISGGNFVIFKLFRTRRNF